MNPSRSAPRSPRLCGGSRHDGRRSARGRARGVALTEFLLCLPVFGFLVLAVARVGQAQALLAPAHQAARYAAWTQARLGNAPTDDEVRRFGHVPDACRISCEASFDPQGAATARALAPLRAPIFAGDWTGVGRAAATVRVREGARGGSRLFPSASVESRVIVLTGDGIPGRGGWVPALGEGPSRFWSAAYGGGSQR